METAILVFHFVIAIFLIGSILLQHGKGADMGATFGAGSSQTVFGPRGAATFLNKMTIVVALLFLCTSATLTYISRQDARSVLDEAAATSLEEVVAPAADGDAAPSEKPEVEQPAAQPEAAQP